MAEGLNRVILLGNLGADPELRFTTSGTAVLNFRLATSESFIDRNKEAQQRTDWHQVVVWGARAEGLSKVLTKGTCLLVEGGIRTSSYEKDGTKRYKTEIHAREIYFPGQRSQTAQSEEPPGRAAAVPARNGAAHSTVARNGAARQAREEPLMEEMPY